VVEHERFTRSLLKLAQFLIKIMNYLEKKLDYSISLKNKAISNQITI
jgi:hypothetical protein